MTEERVKRKLSAILSADVAGYSRLMGEDEVSTVRTLEAYRKVMADLIEQFRGRVVDSPGDNLLAEFSSVVDAVQCAVEIHEVIRAKNEELPEDHRMLFRIGVNLGDVIEEGDRIYGDGVNIAARLEGLAEPGGVCISGSAHEQIENKLALGYEYLGEHTVKNIAKPVKVYRVPMGPKAVTPKEEKDKKAGSKTWQRVAFPVVAIIILGSVAIWYFSFRQAPVVKDVEEAPKTIAVIPFVNLSPDPDQEYFVDGLSEELLNNLAQVSELRVTSRTSSFSFKGTDKKVQEIANELGVAHILEGSVRKAGNALRITAQLIRAKDDFHLWSKTYDRELKDIFEVQEDIAKAVANELMVTLGIGTSIRQLGGTNNVAAYELYLVAKGLCGAVGEGEVYEISKRGLESIDAAIALDQEFAPAWAVKATFHLLIMAFGPAGRAHIEMDEAIRAAKRAVEIEPNLAAGYVPVGYIEMSKGDWIAAEAAFQKALELETESSTSGGMMYISLYYIGVGNFKKTNEILKEHRKNDPLDMASRGSYMINFVLLGDPQKAEEEFNRCRVLFGDQWGVGNQFVLPICMGDHDGVTSDDIIYPNRIFDIAKANLDSPEEAIKNLRRIFDDDQSVSHADCMFIALCAAWFGDSEFAMDAMERGLHINTSGAFWVWMPVFHEVRQFPRFKELVRDIGLVDYWNRFGWPDICRLLDNGDFECD